ncbi:MAG TPA: hypothetical protein VI749_02245 [Candidatus Omnitrophota bacterium]|nr:hypothetical protein [Candidatus Omnitrophota bacterium]
MKSLLPQYLDELEQAKKTLNKNKSTQLHSQRQKNNLRVLIEKYFNDIRPTIISAADKNKDIEVVDSDMQKLLLLCHKRGATKTYIGLITKIRKALITLDARILATLLTPNEKGAHIDNKTDGQIISTLQQIVPSAALSYKQALLDLQIETRYSWRGPATDLRESLRETLDYLAPDNDVIQMKGYKQEPDANGPTMKQKARYIMRKRGGSKSSNASVETAADSIEEIVGSFVRSVYTRSNVSTHTPTDKKEVGRVRDFVRVVLCELLEI